MRPNIVYSAGCLFRLGWVTLVLVAVLALVKQFVFDVIPVSGPSMFPTFSSGDWIVLNKISYVIGKPERGDSVVLRFPGDPNYSRYIKRLIGLPGDKLAIKNGLVYINGTQIQEPYLAPNTPTTPDQEIQLKDHQYYLMGDNRLVSNDSRIWGVASETDFIGKAFFIVLPPQHFQPIVNPPY